MSGKLRLWIEDLGDGSGKLFAEFETRGFCGVGSAFFNLQTLVKKAADFAQYPLLAEQFPCLEGGYLRKDDFKKLAQEHLHISAFPNNLRGGISLLVRLAEPHDDSNSHPSPRYAASAEFIASYQQLNEFSSNLDALARGNISEFVFNEQ